MNAMTTSTSMSVIIMLVHEYDCCARGMAAVWCCFSAMAAVSSSMSTISIRFSDSPSWEEVTLGSDVGGRGSCTCPEPKLCQPGGADPPADVGAMNLGHQKVADWRMLTVTLKLPCYYNIKFFYCRLCVLVYA